MKPKMSGKMAKMSKSKSAPKAKMMKAMKPEIISASPKFVKTKMASAKKVKAMKSGKVY